MFAQLAWAGQFTITTTPEQDDALNYLLQAEISINPDTTFATQDVLQMVVNRALEQYVRDAKSAQIERFLKSIDALSGDDKTRIENIVKQRIPRTK
jgi:hypothetical protein